MGNVARKERRDDLLKTLSHNLKFIFAHTGYTQKDVAMNIRVSQSAISHYTTGTSAPDVFILYDLCKYLTISMEDIFNVTLNIDNYTDFIKEPRQVNRARDYVTYNTIVDKQKKFADMKYHCYYCNTDEKQKYIKHGQMSTGPYEGNNYISMNAMLSRRKYEGKLVLLGNYFYIYLSNYHYDERLMIAMHHHNSPKSYIGGVGSMLSISTGAAIPCHQNIIISAMELSDPDLDKLNFVLKIKSNKNKNDQYVSVLPEEDDKLVYEYLKDKIKKLSDAYSYEKGLLETYYD